MPCKIRLRFNALACVVAAALLSACAGDKTILQPVEQQLDIDGPATREFHSSLYFSNGLSLRFPGYLIGLQKSPRDLIAGPERDKPAGGFLRVPGKVPYFDEEQEADLKFGQGSYSELKSVYEDQKSFYVHHVTRYFDNKAGAPLVGDCFIYNAFMSGKFGDQVVEDLVRSLGWKQCEKNFQWSQQNQNSFYDNGLPALELLSEQVAKDIQDENITHILVIVMGWNTGQTEAIRNINDIAGTIVAAEQESRRAGDKSFRPLVIGVTWSSYWTSGIMNLLSYFNKAQDADEIGVSWLNLLLNQILPTAASDGKIPVVVIGHSFGARAVTRAVFSSPALERSDPKVPKSGVDLVVGLEGAFSINRFMTEGGNEGHPYRAWKDKLADVQVALTASKFDDATSRPFWYHPAGSYDAFRETCGLESGTTLAAGFECRIAREGEMSGQPKRAFELCNSAEEDCVAARQADKKFAWPESKLLYIDTSQGITQYNSLGSGNNAHSDIYRISAGRLLWMLIDSIPPCPDGRKGRCDPQS